MIKVSAPTIELALLEAGKKLKCQCVDLEYEIIENPRAGFLGFGKKDAKIVASIKQKKAEQKPQSPIDLQESSTENSIIEKIKKEIDELFSLLPITLEKIEVSLIDKNTVSIYFSGKDAALLIGEKGYRYKAISYLLYNWLNTSYGVNVRLEIESFLASQEAMIANYLAPIIESLKTSNDTFTTKPFDGILAYIALKELRAKLKNKNIVLKTNEYDENYIVIMPLKSNE